MDINQDQAATQPSIEDHLAGANALINDMMQILTIYANPENYAKGLDHKVAQDFCNDLINRGVIAVMEQPQPDDGITDAEIVSETPNNVIELKPQTH